MFKVDALTVIVPVFPPLQITSVEAAGLNTGSWFTVIAVDAVDEQLLASVTVTTYVVVVVGFALLVSPVPKALFHE